MIVLLQSLVLTNDDDRFDYVAKSAPDMPEPNRVRRHFELDYTGMPTIVASKSRVRLVAGSLEWEPQPWPNGETAESFQAKLSKRDLQ